GTGRPARGKTTATDSGSEEPRVPAGKSLPVGEPNCGSPRDHLPGIVRDRRAPKPCKLAVFAQGRSRSTALDRHPTLRCKTCDILLRTTRHRTLGGADCSDLSGYANYLTRLSPLWLCTAFAAPRWAGPCTAYRLGLWLPGRLPPHPAGNGYRLVHLV